MANRRMFSKNVVDNDIFLDMPSEAQLLYFHLGMQADDDGFITPKKVMRSIGAAEDNLRILIAKGFIIPFESGVIVITHWRDNNYLQGDRHKDTIYQKELKKLDCIQNVYKMYTQDRIGKDSIGINTEPEYLFGPDFPPSANADTPQGGGKKPKKHE